MPNPSYDVSVVIPTHNRSALVVRAVRTLTGRWRRGILETIQRESLEKSLIQSPEGPVMAVEVSKRLFTVDEYHQMGETGILSEDDRVELIDGEIIEMSPIGRRHAACVDRLTRLFVTRLGKSAIVRVQNPILLTPRSEPQPDLALLWPRDDFYASGHPQPADILLVVEVAETSASFDREVKMPRYAQAAVPEAWLVDLSAGRVEVYRNPGAGGYEHLETASTGDHLVPLGFPHIPISVDEVLV